MRMNSLIKTFVVGLALSSSATSVFAQTPNTTTTPMDAKKTDSTSTTVATPAPVAEKPAPIKKISKDAALVRDYVMPNPIIAHRGSTYWVPEETEAAFRWARNIGADYLEIDVQRTKDGVLLALHDNNLRRTTNVAEVYPDRADSLVSAFTYEELLKLDAGSWFNNDPKTAEEAKRPAFAKLEITTLEDVIQIAQGKRIARNSDGTRKYKKDKNGKYTFSYEKDKADNGNRPGVYIETKEPKYFPGIELDVYNELDRLGWNIVTKPADKKEPFIKDKKVNTGNTNGKIIMQTFSNASLLKINEVFKGKVPTCYLLWSGDEFLATSVTEANYVKAINFAVDNKANFIGPSIAGAPNDYYELLDSSHGKMIHQSGMEIHAYSFDTNEQMVKYYGDGKKEPHTDAMFTNRSDLTIQFYQKIGKRDKNINGNNTPSIEILKKLGY